MRWMGFRGEGKKSNHRFHRFEGERYRGTCRTTPKFWRGFLGGSKSPLSQRFLTRLKICVIYATCG
jgi:hypothetical protein